MVLDAFLFPCPTAARHSNAQRSRSTPHPASISPGALFHNALKNCWFQPLEYFDHTLKGCSGECLDGLKAIDAAHDQKLGMGAQCAREGADYPRLSVLS
jgi:hypothetical protein